MTFIQIQKLFDVRSLLLGEEEWNFLPEVLFRSMIMFIVTLVALRLIGRRGIMQGVFELVTIITLGSAAGDPMFYKKVGLLPAILVFVVIVLMYRIINFFVGRYEKVEHLVEGRHVRLIRDGRFEAENFKHEELSKDEIFSDLRLHGASHLGQVQTAYIEPSGEMSVFFYDDGKVRYGLPTIPELLDQQTEKINQEGYWSCGFCGNTQELQPIEQHSCPVCQKKKWVKSVNYLRVK
ncbi:MAG: DUF421 domain-containing protein [Chitinophagaceae bacterium]